MQTEVRLIKPTHAALIGAVLALIAVIFAEVIFGGQGHRIDFNKLPPEVRAIAMENHPNPITSEQWRRMDKAIEQHGGWPTPLELLGATIQKALPLFLALPALSLVILLIGRRRLSPLSAALLFLPSVTIALVVLLAPHENSSLVQFIPAERKFLACATSPGLTGCSTGRLPAPLAATC